MKELTKKELIQLKGGHTAAPDQKTSLNGNSVSACCCMHMNSEYTDNINQISGCACECGPSR